MNGEPPPGEWLARYWHYRAQAHRELIATLDRLLAEALESGAGIWTAESEARHRRTRAKLVEELEHFEARAAACRESANKAQQNPEQGENDA